MVVEINEKMKTEILSILTGGCGSILPWQVLDVSSMVGKKAAQNLESYEAAAPSLSPNPNRTRVITSKPSWKIKDQEQEGNFDPQSGCPTGVWYFTAQTLNPKP